MQDSPQQTTPAWFSSEPAEQPQYRSKKHPSIVYILLVVVLIGLAIVGVMIWVSSKSQCISAEQYKMLSGSSLAAEDGSIGMYTATTAFTTKGTLEPSGVETINRLANFYSNHPHSSLRFDVKSSFSSLDDKSDVQNNSIKLRKELIDSGVPAAATTIQQPTYLASEDDTPTAAPSYTVSVVAERCS